MGDHGGDGGVTHSGLRYRLPSPTSSVVEEDKVIVNNKSSILPSGIVTPLIWDMDGGSGAMKGPQCYSGAWAPSSWRTSFRNLILGVICRCHIMPDYPHPSWHGKDCFSTWRVLRWMIITSFGEIMLLKLRSGGNIGLHPMYLLLTVVLLVVVLLHCLLLVRAHRLFPHLCLTLSRSFFFEAEEELPRGEDGEVEKSSGILVED